MSKNIAENHLKILIMKKPKLSFKEKEKKKEKKNKKASSK